jgi:hypothetical protein
MENSVNVSFQRGICDPARVSRGEIMPTSPSQAALRAWATAQELSEDQGRAGSEREKSHGSDQKNFARIEASGKSEIARVQHRPGHEGWRISTNLRRKTSVGTPQNKDLDLVLGVKPGLPQFDPVPPFACSSPSLNTALPWRYIEADENDGCLRIL